MKVELDNLPTTGKILIFFAFVSYIIYLIAAQGKARSQIGTWPEVQGEVVYTNNHYLENKAINMVSDHILCPSVKYKFTTSEGQEISVERGYPAKFCSSTEKGFNLAKRLNTRDKIIVKYNPVKPEESVILTVRHSTQ